MTQGQIRAAELASSEPQEFSTWKTSVFAKLETWYLCSSLPDFSLSHCKSSVHWGATVRFPNLTYTLAQYSSGGLFEPRTQFSSSATSWVIRLAHFSGIISSFLNLCAVRSSVTFNSGSSSSFSHAYRQGFACMIPSVLEKEIATHSSTVAWKIPRTEEPGRVQSMGSQRVGHDWVTSLSFFLSFSFCLEYPSTHTPFLIPTHPWTLTLTITYSRKLPRLYKSCWGSPAGHSIAPSTPLSWWWILFTCWLICLP